MKTFRFEIQSVDFRNGTIIEVKETNRENALQKAMRVTQLPRSILIYKK